MAKVFGIHPFELKQGVNPEAFEQFVRETVPNLPKLDDNPVDPQKDRGDRAGQKRCNTLTLSCSASTTLL